MAQTSDGITACNAVIKIDNNAGNPTDMSGSMSDASMSLSKDMGEATTFAGNYKLQSECKRGGTFSLTAIYTTNVAEARQLLEDWYDLGGKRTVELYPYGTSIGSRFYRAEVRLSSLDIPVDSSSADYIKVSGEGVIDGALAMLNVSS